VAVINLRRPGQYTFADGLIAEQTAELWEPWMRHADTVLEDEQLLNLVYEALLKRRPKSRTRGRLGAPAEMVVRMLLLKHIRNWSFDVLEREVRANLVYREFARIGAAKVPDAKTLGRQARALGPEVIEKIHERVVALAVENRVIQGRRMRVDTTVVETDIHYPTDSSLLGDGNRVLTRLMKKVTGLAGEAGTKVRDRMRSVQRRVSEIGRAARVKGEKGKEKLQGIYRKLLHITGRVVAQAKRFSSEIESGVKGAADALRQERLQSLRQEIDTIVCRTQQVVKQARARVFGGDTHVEGKLVSIFEPSTEVIRKGKASKPTEFGKMVRIQEAENQVVIDFEVYDKKPSDSDLLIPSIEAHQQLMSRAPELVAADAGFYSAKNEAKAGEMGVQRISVPNRSTKSAERKQRQKERWFKRGQKWRTGCEGRISLLKRRHGLNRSRYKGEAGIKRWVGLGVIADNVINIGRAMANRAI
jgi:IS5 family transposase